jgi:hypothetical protein
MRIITLWQPYASLIAVRAKPFETRAYPPPAKLIGQRIAIHAAVRKPDKLTGGIPPEAWAPAIDALSASIGDFSWHDLPRGAVVCTAVLAGAYRLGDSIFPGRADVVEFRGPSHWDRDDINIDPFGDYSPGRWAWLLTDVQRLDPPVPARGKQGWWEWEAAPCA